MKVAQQKEIFNAVRINIEHFIATQGEGELLCVEHFNDTMFDLFSSLYEREIEMLNKHH